MHWIEKGVHEVRPHERRCSFLWDYSIVEKMRQDFGGDFFVVFLCFGGDFFVVGGEIFCVWRRESFVF